MAQTGMSIIVDTRAFKRLGNNLRKVDPLAYKAAQKVIRATVFAVAQEAMVRSSFSVRIPGSVKVRMMGLNAKIQAGGGNAWIAVPIENRGEGFVTHPTFNHDPITNKNSHPAFLGPPFNEHRDEIIAALSDAIVNAVGDALEGL